MPSNTETTYPDPDKLIDAQRHAAEQAAAMAHHEQGSKDPEAYKKAIAKEIEEHRVEGDFAGGRGGGVVDIFPGQGGKLPFRTARVGGRDYEVISTISVLGREREDVGPNNPIGTVVDAAHKSRGTLAMLRDADGTLSAVAISEDEFAAGEFDIPTNDPTRPLHSFGADGSLGFNADIAVGDDQWDAPAKLAITKGPRGSYGIELHQAMGAQAVVMQSVHRHDMAMG